MSSRFCPYLKTMQERTLQCYSDQASLPPSPLASPILGPSSSAFLPCPPPTCLPLPSSFEVLDFSSDGSVSTDEEPAVTSSPFPRTPATTMTMSEEYGSPHWAFGALQPALAAGIMLDDDEPMAAPVDWHHDW